MEGMASGSTAIPQHQWQIEKFETTVRQMDSDSNSITKTMGHELQQKHAIMHININRTNDRNKHKSKNKR
jgi:hypothetical protein